MSILLLFEGYFGDATLLPLSFSRHAVFITLKGLFRSSFNCCQSLHRGGGGGGGGRGRGNREQGTGGVVPLRLKLSPVSDITVTHEGKDWWIINKNKVKRSPQPEVNYLQTV